MKALLPIIATLYTLSAGAQSKTMYTVYNKLTELQETNYVVASAENRSKLSVDNRYLLFINTATGESRQIDFPKDAFISKVEQVKLDSLAINKVIIVANTVNLDGDKSIDWNDPQQLIVCSVDGKEKVQITPDSFFVRTWLLHRRTGVLVITGHSDTNNNGKYDRSDKGEVLLYDLGKMAVIKML